VVESEVGKLAHDLHRGYMAYAGTTAIMRHPYTLEVIERLEAENTGPAIVPIESIVRRDGTAAFFSLSYAVREIATDDDYQEVHDRLWLAGALITLGDELKRVEYFDKGPDLEFVRHLRNGIGHGNRFHFIGDEPTRPAHFTGPAQRLQIDGHTPTPPGQAHTFRIDRNLQGHPVLFDFMGPGDVCDLLMFVGWRLGAISRGDPDFVFWEQAE
jgi:hypothetical protein